MTDSVQVGATVGANGDGPSSEEADDSMTLVHVALERRDLRHTLLMIMVSVVALLVVLWAWGLLAHFLFNILLAWLVAISFDPVVKWLNHHGWSRGLATALVALVNFLVLVGFIALFGGVLATQMADLVSALPELLTNVAGWINTTFGASIDPNQLTSNLNLTQDQITGVAGNLAGGILGVALSVVGLVFDFVTIIVFSIYFSADGPRIKRFVASWLRPAHQMTFIRVWDISVEKAGGFVLSKLALATLSAAFHVGFFFLIDVPYWLPMGIFAGLVSQFIPTIGTYIGVALPALFSVFDDPIDVLWIVVFATVYQQVENYVFTPRISTRTMDINSGLALAAVFVGAALFGPIGAIIGIPLVAIVIAVLEAYGNRYAVHPFVERNAD